MEKRNDIVIVSNNREQIEWLKQKGITGIVKTHISINEAMGKHIYGVVPYVIAAVARDITIIDCKPIGKIKSKDMTVEQLNNQNAQLKTYRVIPS